MGKSFLNHLIEDYTKLLSRVYPIHTMEIVWRFLKKLKIELPYDHAILLLGIYLEKNIFQKKTCAQVFMAALLTKAKSWKQPKCPSTEKRIKTMRSMYTLEYYSVIKKDEIMSSGATSVDLETVILSEVGQTEQEKYHVASLTCGLPHGSVVKNLPATRNTGVAGSTPESGRPPGVSNSSPLQSPRLGNPRTAETDGWSPEWQRTGHNRARTRYTGSPERNDELIYKTETDPQTSRESL